MHGDFVLVGDDEIQTFLLGAFKDLSGIRKNEEEAMNLWQGHTTSWVLSGALSASTKLEKGTMGRQ